MENLNGENEDGVPFLTERILSPNRRDRIAFLFRTLRSRNNNQLSGKTPLDAEEQIIQKRGRRQWVKLIPKTPPARNKRPISAINDNSSSSQLTPESPFTKCLRGLAVSPIPKRDQQQSSNLSRVLSSSEAPKRFYYSPNPPYSLRSMDNKPVLNDSGISMSPIDLLDSNNNHQSKDSSLSIVNSTMLNQASSILIQSATIDSSTSKDMVPTPSSSSCSSSQEFISCSSSSTTNLKDNGISLTNSKRINRVRRRFRF